MLVFFKVFGLQQKKEIDLSDLDPDFKKNADGSVEVFNGKEKVAHVSKEEVALIAKAIDGVR